MALPNTTSAGPGITGPITKMVWDGLLTAEYNMDYYVALQDHYSPRDKALRIATGATSTSTIGAISAFGIVPGSKEVLLILSAALGLAAAILADVTAVADFQSRLNAFGVQYAAWAQVKEQYQDLWDQVQVGVDVTMAQVQAANKVALAAESKELTIPRIPKLQNECKDEVLKAHGLSPS